MGIKQLNLFEDLDKEVKEKVKKRKGLITIKNLDSKENPYAVDFEGHNEGSGFPCADEKEVDKDVKSLVEKHKDNYNLTIKDERQKEKVGKIDWSNPKSLSPKEKIGKIKIERRSNGEHGVFPEIDGEFLMGFSSKDSEGKEKEEIEKAREYLLGKGIKDISIYETKYVYFDEPKNVEKNIETKSKELKELLKKKFGYAVKIRVMKDDN